VSAVLKNPGSTLLRAVVVLVLCVFAAFPVYWMINTATSTNEELYGSGQSVGLDLARLPQVFEALTMDGPLRWLANSAIVATGTTVLSLSMAVVVGYSISRFRYAGRGALSFALFTTQMMPEALLVVPLYAVFVALGLINGLTSLVLANTAFAMPVAVWIVKSALDKVPYEIEEAARVDGCSRGRILFRILLPLVLPSIAAAGVITFFEGWNEYLFATTFIQDQHLWPASRGVASFIGEFVTPLPVVFSVALVFSIPAVVFFLLVQRWIVSGLTAGSVKG
jgi:multiple sugar transport system permease protein